MLGPDQISAVHKQAMATEGHVFPRLATLRTQPLSLSVLACKVSRTFNAGQNELLRV